MSIRTIQYWEKNVIEILETNRNQLHMRQSEAAKQKISRLELNIVYPPTTFWDWVMWNSRPVTVIRIERPDERSKDEREADRAKVIGTILAAGAALATGLFAAIYGLASRKLHRTKELMDQTSEDFGGANGEQIMPCFTDLFKAQLQIDQRNYGNACHKLASAVLLLAGGVSLAAGGLMVSSALITAGYVTALFGMIGMLASIGYHWNDGVYNRGDAQRIVGYKTCAGTVQEGLADAVLRELQSYIVENGVENGKFFRQEAQQNFYVPIYGEADFVEEGAPGYTSGQPSAPQAGGEGEREQVEGATA